MSTETQLVIAVALQAIAIAIIVGYLFIDWRWSREKGENMVRQAWRESRTNEPRPKAGR